MTSEQLPPSDRLPSRRCSPRRRSPSCSASRCRGVFDAAEDGRLPKLKLGRHLRFRADALARILDDLAS